MTEKLALGVVVLAAGLSRRMGTPKMLLPWQGTTVIGHLLRQWARLGSMQIAVVCAGEDRQIAMELDRLLFRREHRIYNAAPELGMFSSIRCAALWEGWVPQLSHWVIVLGDQPHLRHGTLELLVRFAATHPSEVCQPSRGSRPKHPVILPRVSFHALRSATATNLKDFLAGYRVALCEMEDPALELDLDTPQDYERALRLVAGPE